MRTRNQPVPLDDLIKEAVSILVDPGDSAEIQRANQHVLSAIAIYQRDLDWSQRSTSIAEARDELSELCSAAHQLSAAVKSLHLPAIEALQSFQTFEHMGRRIRPGKGWVDELGRGEMAWIKAEGKGLPYRDGLAFKSNWAERCEALAELASIAGDLVQSWESQSGANNLEDQRYGSPEYRLVSGCCRIVDRFHKPISTSLPLARLISQAATGSAPSAHWGEAHLTRARRWWREVRTKSGMTPNEIYDLETNLQVSDIRSLQAKDKLDSIPPDIRDLALHPVLMPSANPSGPKKKRRVRT
ncbi:MAG: hypothetical protein U0P81_11255 [Holophagaceae bacterium]